MGRYQGGYDLIEKYANDRTFRNNSDFARFLHEVEPQCSVNSWRCRIQRWVKQGNDFRDTTTTELSVNKIRVYYDKANDTYLTVLDALGGEMVAIDGEKHRNMKKDYSDDGNGLSATDLARKYGIPTGWIKEYIRVNEWNHGMDIFTDEEVMTKTTDDLVNETLAVRRMQVAEKVESKRWAEIEKDANAYRSFSDTILNEFLTLIPKVKTTTKNRIKMTENGNYAVVISPTDLHYGKYGWKDEVGEEYDLDEARSRLIDRTNNLISRLPSRPDKVIVTAGSDWFHVDNDAGTTTKGTAQDMAATPAQILMGGCELAREHIEMLRAVSPVQVVFMCGNHDRHSNFALMMYLSALYENADDVEVIVSPYPRQYIKYGNSLLGFTHGDGVRGNDLPALMATEERQAWGEREHHYWFHGHLHHMRLTEKAGCTVIQLPSLAGHDRYHARKGYVLARAGICAHIVDKELGLVGNLFSPVVHE